jgi:hypothetical protein
MLCRASGWKSRRDKPAGASRSRLRTREEISADQAERREPSARRTARGRGAKVRAEHQVNLAAP